MAGNKDDWMRAVRLAEPALKVRAAHARHPDIDDDAIRLAQTAGVKEYLSGRKDGAFVSGRPEQAAQSISNRFIVVYDANQ